MAKAKRPHSNPQKTSSRTRNSSATVSGPAKPGPRDTSDDVANKVAGTQELASAFAFNANKPLEYDAAAATAPPQGISAAPDDPIGGRQHGDREARVGEGG